MKRIARLGVRTGLLIATALAACVPVFASTSSATDTVKWQTQALIKIALTPNYSTGFGSVKAVIGTQPAPTHGPNAGPAIGQGDIDFGTVLSGTSYLYKFAAHVNVTSNDPNGFSLYGQGAADFQQTSGGGTMSTSQTLYYLRSVSGGADSNTGFTPGLPFYNAPAGQVSGFSYAVAPTISPPYGSPIATSAIANNDFYYDYQLKVPATASNGLYYLWVVYTVVAR